jgi:tetratricopeptide (TPR) repeat protein
MNSTNQRQEAVDITQKALQLHPGDPLFLTVHSRALAGNSQFAEALHFAREAAKRNKDSVVLSNLSQRLHENGANREALHVALDAFPEGPKTADDVWTLVMALAHDGKVTEAVDLAREKLAMHPGDAGYLSNLSAALRTQKKTLEALEMARESVRADPRSFRLKRMLIYRLVEAGYPAEAVTYARELLKLAPEDSLAQYALALALNATGSDFQEAYDWASKAVNQAPRVSALHSELAQAAFGLQKWDVAVCEWSKTLELYPNEFKEDEGLPFWGERARNFEYAKQHLNQR